MEHFAQLNFRYPGTPDVPRLHVSQQLHGSAYHVVQDVQSMQDRTHPGEEYICPDSTGMTHAHRSLDATAGHGLYPRTLISPRGAVHSDPSDSIQLYYPADASAHLSDLYIPSSSDKITCTDHRPLDAIFANTRSPSGWPQAKSGSVHPSHNGATHGHPRHTSPVLTYSLPTRPQMDGVVQIPLLAVDNQMSGTGLIVDFRCSDWGIGIEVQGIPMSDLLHGNVSGLEDPYQRVLDGLGITELRFNILWPHYPPFAKTISAFGTDGKLITRAGLGYEAALAFAEFFYQITSQSIPPTQPGPYTIASGSSTGSSTDGIKFDQLHLITVRNTSRGEWIAEIRAVLMP